MNDAPIYLETLAKNCLRMSDDTLAFLAHKIDENVYTIRTAGGDLSLTDKDGLLLFLNGKTEEEPSGVDVEGLPVGGPKSTRRNRSVRHNGGVDHLRDTVAPTGVAEGPQASRGGPAQA